MGRPTAYYTLAEAAAILHKSENDLLRMAGTGGLSLYVSYNGRVLDDSKKFPTYSNLARPGTNWWFSGELIVSASAATKLLTSHIIFCYEFESCEGNDKDDSRLKRIYPANHYGESIKTPITRDRLLVALDAASQENAHDCKSLDSLKALLDPVHPWHSELLAIAIKGWLELYSNREGNRSDNTHKPPGGHIAMIEEWLSGQISPLLSGTSIGYLGKVINPSKGGGPNKSQE